jgi:magnesium-transporting ATPase (P-type)
MGLEERFVFLVAEAKVEGLTETRRSRFERVGEVPFSSERKLMSTLHADLLLRGHWPARVCGSVSWNRRRRRARGAVDR